MRFLSLSLLAASAMAHAQVDQFVNAPWFAWGAGTGLPTPYTQTDMNITLEARIFGVWVPYNLTGAMQELAVAKTVGSANFSIPISAISTVITTSQPLNWSGSVVGQQVTWTANQTFSQAGGYPINGSFTSNGSPVAINIVVNNVLVTGSLRSQFASTSPLPIAPIGRVANVRGTHSGGDAFNLIDMVAGSTSGTVAGLPTTGFRVFFRNIQHIMHPPMPFRVTGTIDLSDVSSSAPFLAKIDVLPAAGGAPEWTWTGPFSESLPFELKVFGFDPVPITAPANRKLRIRAGSHLSKTVPITLWENPAVVNLVLTNGDVDGSEEVDAADIDMVILHFGENGQGLSVWPDVDHSGEVDAADIDIVIANFGAVGDLG